MNLKFKSHEIACLLFFLIITCGCTKPDDSERFKPYLGEWQFRVYRVSPGPASFEKIYDTIDYSGSIQLNDTYRGVVINFAEDASISAWIEGNALFRNGANLGSIDTTRAHFQCIVGSGYNIESDDVHGTRKPD